jgi:CelD/BcsL family acetyltransferase involved in cellulose biosynthesis
VVEEITSWGALEPLREDWSHLCDRSPRVTPFQRPEWLLPWGRCFPPGKPWILAVREEERLVALAPWLLYTNEGKKTVAFCGGGVSDYLDVIADPDHEQRAIVALLDHLAVHRDRWEVCDFEPVPDSSPLLRVPPPDGFEARTEPRDVSPGLVLPDRAEDLREVVPTRQLANLRKYRRKAAAVGALHLERADETNWEELLEILTCFYIARRIESGEPGLLDGNALRNFQSEVAAGFLSRDRLGLYALRLDADPIAALYGFHERDTFYCYMQGFDAAHSKLSPGVMLGGGVIEDLIGRGVKRIDFLRGPEPYKYWWGAEDRETFRRTLFGSPSPPRSSSSPGG